MKALLVTSLALNVVLVGTIGCLISPSKPLARLETRSTGHLALHAATGTRSTEDEDTFQLDGKAALSGRMLPTFSSSRFVASSVSAGASVRPQHSASVTTHVSPEAADRLVTGRSGEQDNHPSLPQFAVSTGASSRDVFQPPPTRLIATPPQEMSRKPSAPYRDAEKQGAALVSTANTSTAPHSSSTAARPADVAAEDARGGLFTTDEQRYRSMYGWSAFYSAKQAQAQQAAKEGPAIR